jgi:hypothetical protein
MWATIGTGIAVVALIIGTVVAGVLVFRYLTDMSGK